MDVINGCIIMLKLIFCLDGNIKLAKPSVFEC